MPISYINSSSSVASYNSGCARADGTNGIPEQCYCGRTIIIEESTAPGSLGRKFYTCPAILGEDSPDHISIWWDEAIVEQLSILQIRIDQQTLRMESYNRTTLLQVNENIGEIKGILVEMQSEVVRMKEAFENRVYGDIG
ncbi:uncharacterized protein At4g04775-like [Eutrema salsugineum]|uniref:uncharacterized protein At4g04775-like n=1 Tax=Eutrema salsugineum TaxID=72664 RepID=UPI000CED5217|nr:uncharacterized protein At4g04775-like [Eutrema salsugineum]